MTLTPEQERILAERYGVKKSSTAGRRRKSIAALAGVGVLTLGAWWFSSANYNPVSYEVTSYQVLSDWALRIEFQVTAPIGTELSCDLQGLDSSFGVVAQKTVSLPAGDMEVLRYSVDLRTSAKAVTGVIDSCRIV